MANAKRKTRKTAQVSTAVHATLAVTLLPKSERTCVTAIVMAQRTLTTAKAAIESAMAKLFPSKPIYRQRDHYRLVMRAIREETKNGKGYKVARDWCVATYGGLLDKDGNIATAAYRAKNGTKGMTLGRFAHALDEKFEALTSYIGKVPKDSIEPAMLESLQHLVDIVLSAREEFDAYIEREKVASEAATESATA